MELSIITIKQVFMLFILIFAGVICAKTKVVKMEGKKAFSDLLIYLVVPAMILHSYMREFDPNVVNNLLLAFGLSAILLLIGLGITMALSVKIKNRNRPILRLACIFSNAAYMGFPLIQALFGSEGLLYASAFITIYNILLWTVGYAMVSGKVRIKEVVYSIFTMPVILSVILGLAIYLARIPVPDIIETPMNLIGNMNTPLSMFITGMIIAGSDFKKMLCNIHLVFVIAVRMIVIPVVCFLVFALLGVHGIVAQVTLLLEACPCAAITSVFAVQFHYDEDFAAGAVVISTFLSILTLPVFAMFLQ